MPVTIIIPTKDRPYLLKEALDSVIKQSSDLWRCVVVDDHSNEKNSALNKKAVESLGRRGIYLRLPKSQFGANSARNLGLRNTESAYCIFLDDDDLLSPDRIAQSFRLLDPEGSPDFVLFDYIKRWSDKDEYCESGSEDDLVAFLRSRSPWMTSSPTWKVDGLRTIGGWREGLLFWQDWELHCRAIIYGLSYRFLHQPGYIWRQDVNCGARISEKGGHIDSWISVEAAIIDLLTFYREKARHSQDAERAIYSKLRYALSMQARLRLCSTGLIKWLIISYRLKIPAGVVLNEVHALIKENFGRIKTRFR